MLQSPNRGQGSLVRCAKMLYSRYRSLFQAKARNCRNKVTIKLGDVYKTWQLTTRPDSTVSLTRRHAMKFYEDMTRIRYLEHGGNALHKEKCNCSSCCTQTRQEAIAVGMNAALRPKDCVITGYRCHGWSMLRGLPELAILNEFTRRQSDCQRCADKGTRMREHVNSGCAQVSVGTGIALACKFKGDNSVCVMLQGGSSATNQPRMFASYLMARLWKLPAIFVCENRKYGMGTVIEQSDDNKDDFPLPGIYVDGMDVLAVRNATTFAMNFVDKYGPIVVEAHTGHTIADARSSFGSMEVPLEVLKQRDPIEKFKKVCILHGLVTEDELKLVDEKIQKHLDGMLEKIKKSKETQSSEKWTDILDENEKTGIRVSTEVKQNHFRVGSSRIIATDLTEKQEMLAKREKITAIEQRKRGGTR